eukprot:m.99199 g.99199  ORF g.99199 m.99199 type:complete len:1163 (-) comp15323_c0_seq1:26-3514(-)
MATMEAQLRGLEAILGEFLHPGTPPDRKKEIETHLTAFKAQGNALELSLQFLEHTHDSNVQWYSMAVLEYVVTRRWHSQTPQQHNTLYRFLQHFLVDRGPTIAPFVKNKLAQVFVGVGKRSWPHELPDFLDTVLGWAAASGSTDDAVAMSTIGLTVLRVVSEEFTSARDVPTERLRELSSLLQERVPVVMQGIAQLLHQAYDEACPKAPGQQADHRLPLPSDMPPTPRASPTVGLAQARAQHDQQPSGASIGFGSAQHARLELALRCMQQLFVSGDVSKTITPPILEVLFRYAGLQQGDASSLGTLAVGCFVEMLSRHCTPPNFAEYIALLLSYIMQLLAAANAHADADDGYQECLTEFLRLFVELHFHRIQTHASFDAEAFLQQLFTYTFRHAGTPGFGACLNVCASFLSSLQPAVQTAIASGQPAQSTELLGRYQGAVSALCSETLKQALWEHNAEILGGLDTSPGSGSGNNMEPLSNQEFEEGGGLADDAPPPTPPSELEERTLQCLSVVAGCIELYGNELLPAVFAHLQGTVEKFMQIHTLAVAGAGEGSAPVLRYPSQDVQRMVIAVNKDLGVTMRVFGRVAHCFDGPAEFPARFQQAAALLTCATQVGSYVLQSQLHRVDTAFAETLAQVLGTIGAFGHWINRFVAHQHPDPAAMLGQPDAQAVDLVSTIVLLAVGCLAPGLPDVLLETSTSLLLTMVRVVRPPFLPTLAPFSSICEQLTTAATCLPVQVQCNLFVAVASAELLAWPQVPAAAQDMDNRHARLKQTFAPAAGAFAQMIGAPMSFLQPAAIDDFRVRSRVLRAVLTALKGEAKQTRARLLDVIAPLPQAMLVLLPVYATVPKAVSEVLAGIHVLLDSYTDTLGSPFVQEAVRTFLEVFGGAAGGAGQPAAASSNLELVLSAVAEGSAASAMLRRFLQVIDLLVSSPRAVVKPFLPDLVALCVLRLYPALAHAPGAADLRPALFRVFRGILLNNWQFFFGSSGGRAALALRLGGPAAAASAQQAQPQQPGPGMALFVPIMEAFGTALTQTDIACFKLSLETLELLHEKHKLYDRAELQPAVLTRLLATLMRVLCNKTHQLLGDEIAKAVHGMAGALGFERFFMAFLPEFVMDPTAPWSSLAFERRQALVRGFAHDQDLPSFSRSLDNLVSDLAVHTEL